jgi:DNA-binding PadR family transcriptional regulator
MTSPTQAADSRSVRIYQITETGREAYAARVAAWTKHAREPRAFIGGGA